MQRQTWTNRFTYILTVAGATIGFGATWRFPYLVGENGGGAYVLTFILAMLLVGIPIILVENVIGRISHSNAVGAFCSVNGKNIGRYWRIFGYMSLIGSFGILAYYMVLGGWVISYIINIFISLFNSSIGLDLSNVITSEATSKFYTDNIENSPFLIGIYTFLFVIINWFILRKGIIEGIEKSVKWLMPLLFICLILMIARNFTLDGALEGIKFYLVPDFSAITPQLFLYVLGQVFFALSLGFGVIITLSSHLNKEENLVKTAFITGLVNTLIAFLAGFMIFPSLFSVGLSPDSGPSLVFKSLPVAFSHMHFGGFFAVLFFVLLLLAALTTSITIYQVIISVLEEKFKMQHKNAVNLTLISVFIAGNIPCILTYGPWNDVMIFGKNIFDTFDFVSGNIFFVLTALGSVIFVGWVIGQDAINELNNYNGRSKFSLLWFKYIKYFIPFIIIVIFVSSFMLKF